MLCCCFLSFKLNTDSFIYKTFIIICVYLFLKIVLFVISTNSISAYSCHMTYIGCLMFSAVLTMENIYYMLLSSDTWVSSHTNIIRTQTCTPVSSHTKKTLRPQTSVPTSMINISNRCKINKVRTKIPCTLGETSKGRNI